MEPDADSSSNSDAYTGRPIEATAAELEELEALGRAHNRDVAIGAAVRLIGPVVVIGLLVAIASFTYIQVAAFRTRARQELERDPVRGMEKIMRAAGQDAEADRLFSGALDLNDVERQIRDLESTRRNSK